MANLRPIQNCTTYQNGVFEGTILNNRKEGLGIMIYDSGICYLGTELANFINNIIQKLLHKFLF